MCNKGTLTEKKSRYGKLFYSCSTYPKCTYATWNPPIAETCPKCQWPVLTLKTTKRRGLEKKCARRRNVATPNRFLRRTRIDAVIFFTRQTRTIEIRINTNGTLIRVPFFYPGTQMVKPEWLDVDPPADAGARRRTVSGVLQRI